jgi:hypothetical protein
MAARISRALFWIIYYLHAIHRNFVADMGLMTPK